MTEQKKSQGPSLATVAGSAVLMCAVLVGAAYWFRTDQDQTGAEQSPLAASTLQSLYARCPDGLSQEQVDGRTRLRCETQQHPAFIMEVVGEQDAIERASMLVLMGGTSNRTLDGILVGLEMFGLVAGAPPEEFLSKEYLDAVGTSKTSLAHQGRVYSTQAIAKVGLMFAVTLEGADAGRTN